MKCAGCGFDNPDTVSFCGGCGRPFQATCPACGASNPARFRFCGECGTALTESPAPPEPAAAAAPAAEAERRQLTVLFCDLVGSTALSAGLDPEDMRDVLRAYQDACATAVARYEGYVAKFMGDGVFAYFGYPTAHEDDAERAINAGLAIVEAVRGLERDLAVRVGIATGTVAVGDIVGTGAAEEANVVGDAPNLAARLQGIAEPDTVVVAEATYALVEGLYEATDLGPRALKGFAGPVRSWAVHRPFRSESRFAATRGGGLSRLVGREEEIEILSRRWQRTVSGRGQVVLLSGEAGIGKSRLVHEFRDRLRGEDPYVRFLQCSPHHTNSAMFPFVEQTIAVLGIAPGDSEDVKVDKLVAWIRAGGGSPETAAPVFGPVLGIDVSGHFPPLDVPPQRHKELMLQAFNDRVITITRERPFLMIVEDAHWIDPTSLENINAYVDLARDRAFMMVVTYRPEFEAPWVGQPHTALITLNRLDRAECGALASSVSGGRVLSDGLVERIVARTDGIPLFVEELTKTIVESDGLDADPAALERALDAGDIPATLQDALEARLDRLGDARELAQIGAVIGRSFGHRLVAGVSGLDDATLGRRLGQLLRSELVSVRGDPPDAVYTFKHALIQDTAYASLLRSRRREIHGRVADALADGPGEAVETEPEILAHHLTEAGQAARAIEYWRRAGLASIGRAAHREAAEHLRRGLDLLDTLPDTTERKRQELSLQTALGPALQATHGWSAPEAEASYDRAQQLCRELEDSEQLFTTLWGFWAINMIRQNRTRVVEVTAELLALAEDSGDPARLLQAHHAAWGSPFQGKMGDKLEHIERGLEIYDPDRHSSLASTYGNHDVGMCALNHKAIAYWAMGYPDQARRLQQQAVDLVERISHPPSSAHVLHNGAWLELFARDLDSLLPNLEAAVEVSKELGLPTFLPMSSIRLCWARAVVQGDRASCNELGDWIDRIQSTGATLGLGMTHVLHAEAIRATRSAEEALPPVDRSLELMARLDEHLYRTHAITLKGELLLEADPAGAGEAEACFRQAMEIARGDAERMWELRAATRLARLWHGQGRTEEARDLLAPLYGWFTEGFDTLDLIEAKALLDEIG